MSAIGGDIIEITFNHPTLGTGILLPKAAEDSTYDLGGIRATDDKQGITGSGEAIYQMNNSRWQFGCPVSWNMNSRDDLQKVIDMAESPLDADWTITHINGVVHGGKGRPVGDYEGNGNAATFDLLIQGSGKLKKIVG
jgi:hypothetical protein